MAEEGFEFEIKLLECDELGVVIGKGKRLLIIGLILTDFILIFQPLQSIYHHQLTVTSSLV